MSGPGEVISPVPPASPSYSTDPTPELATTPDSLDSRVEALRQAEAARIREFQIANGQNPPPPNPSSEPFHVDVRPIEEISQGQGAIDASVNQHINASPIKSSDLLGGSKFLDLNDPALPQDVRQFAIRIDQSAERLEAQRQALLNLRSRGMNATNSSEFRNMARAWLQAQEEHTARVRDFQRDVSLLRSGVSSRVS
jgi:hypothetical protein